MFISLTGRFFLTEILAQSPPPPHQKKKKNDQKYIYLY